MTQEQAIARLREMVGGRISEHEVRCTGDAETCPVDECLVCGIRDCPDNEPLHYHHDGCPCCDTKENE
jgi:hypothetical protein